VSTRSAAAAKSAQTRSHRAQRLLMTVIGALALIVGLLALVVAQGWLGSFRSRRPVADPLALDWLRTHAVLSRAVALGLGVLMLVFGLVWFVRSLRAERRPDVVLEDDPAAGLTVTADALAGAVAADAEELDGVVRARVRAVGDRGRPALRINLWLVEGADLRAVWHRMDTEVLVRARESLGLDSLPAAVRVELESGAQQRVR
jgi:hypothetical protein